MPSTWSALGVRAADLAPGRPHAERVEPETHRLDEAARSLWHGALAPLLRALRGPWQGTRGFVARVEALGAALQSLDDDALREQAARLRRPLRDSAFAPGPTAHCFALVREASARVLGRRHHATQLAAGWLLLRGTLVEMATGEGKSLAATLPAVAAALAGLPVHVITVNDYLAARDAEAMAPLYRFFGLDVAAVVSGMAPAARRAAYAAAVACVSHKELAFDYLRDRSAQGERAGPLHAALDALCAPTGRPAPTGVLRGLVFGIVDEADSIFIDEARTPLILSADDGAAPLLERCDTALAWAAALVPPRDFVLEPAQRRVRLSAAGRDLIACRLSGLSGATPFESRRDAEEAVHQALAAIHLYQRDRQYVVVDGEVRIVDEGTGRTMPDRRWEQGLHQMIEAREALALTTARRTVARLTYRRLFRRYLRLAGMSGTALEVAGEIGRSFGLAVARVPLLRPSGRVQWPPQCLPDQAAKWQAVAERVEQVALGQRRPVLVGTRTVEASEALAAVLLARGIPHTVLNAKQDGDEAGIVARAGEAGRVTVATNMAGRGTDIVLGPGVAERGGLHVILTEYHESARIDRQLLGRCARQGDPGSTQAIVALNDELFTAHAPRLAALLVRRTRPPGRLALGALRRAAQRAAERRHRQVREGGLQHDDQLAQWLAFSGRGE